MHSKLDIYDLKKFKSTKSLTISKGQSEAVNRGTDNTMAKWNRITTKNKNKNNNKKKKKKKKTKKKKKNKKKTEKTEQWSIECYNENKSLATQTH